MIISITSVLPIRSETGFIALLFLALILIFIEIIINYIFTRNQSHNEKKNNK